MQLSGIRPGDIILAERNGEPRFYALVEDAGDHPTAEVRRGEIITRSIGGGHLRLLTARQIAGHWRARRSRRLEAERDA